ncbi:hypothetical protein [Niveispirillum sp. SYP-B3756]|nr:hypothetical protein [Niveispirillum sp. SYP-B3756]
MTDQTINHEEPGLFDSLHHVAPTLGELVEMVALLGTAATLTLLLNLML